MALDPFTQAYLNIWQALEASTDFTALVKLGNRIKLAGTDIAEAAPTPMKSSIMDADTPEAALIVGGGVLGLDDTMSSSSIVQYYELALTTNDLRLKAAGNTGLLPLYWSVVKAIHKAGNSLLSCPNVFRVRVPRLIQLPAKKEENRGMAGWVSVITIAVEFDFSDSELDV